MAKTFDAELLSLSFVEALILERPERALEIAASVTNADELLQMFYTVSKILAASMEAQHGIGGSIEKIDTWRKIFLDPDAAVAMFE